MYDIEVIMETQTPARTGDAFGESKILKPQSILGSLRFWFEVFCYAAGELNKNCKKEELEQENLSKINEIIEEKGFSMVEAKKKVLNELGISIPSQVFGCNGWEGFIKIKEIRFIDEKEIKLPEVIYKDKEKYDDWKEYNSTDKIDRKKEHAWYFPKSYVFGKLGIKIKLADKKIGEDIIYPLLNFIQRYGFIGGSNNLGFGRVKFTLENINLSEFNKFRFNNKTIEIDDVIEEKDEFMDLVKDDLINKRKIGLFKLGLYRLKDNIEQKNIFLCMIKKLIGEKAKWSAICKNKHIRNNDKRHYIFGSICRDKYEGIEGLNTTKIIPWINSVAKNKYEYGFISLVLLEKFPRG